MDYAQHYSRLIERARNRVLVGYVERHHIVPKCLGGLDDPDNIVRLTPEEHYLAHQLLLKIYPAEKGLICAALYMAGRGRSKARNNKSFGWIRRRQSEARRGTKLSDSTKRKISQALKGRKTRLGTKQPQSFIDQHVNRMRGNQINTGRVWSRQAVEARAKTNSQVQKGKQLSGEHKIALREAANRPLTVIRKSTSLALYQAKKNNRLFSEIKPLSGQQQKERE